MECQTYECSDEAVVRVSGGKKLGEQIGWSGAHCLAHALRVVEMEAFQVQHGMPIKIEQV